MKIAAVVIYLIVLCQNMAADALTNNEPRKDQSNILLTALFELQKHKVPRLHSNLSDAETTYYLRDASFLGRTDTAQGFKNLIRVTFIRSSPYAAARKLPPPPRGHSFVVIFSDDGKPQYFFPLPMPDSAALQDAVLKIDEGQYNLKADRTFKAFTQIKAKGAAEQMVPESKPSKREEPKPE